MVYIIMSNFWESKSAFAENNDSQPIPNENCNSEEDDYMSDAFLAQCTEVKNDVRPGMPMTYSIKRKMAIEKKRKQDQQLQQEQKKHKCTQQDRLNQGLNTALSSENKGFAMLQKMGYKPGTSLGKEGCGRLEPVRVEVKQDRAGFGMKEMLNERRKEKERQYFEKMKKQNLEYDPFKFREHKRLEMQAKQMSTDLYKFQRTCYRLDSENGITEPVDWYFWPENLLPANLCGEDCESRSEVVDKESVDAQCSSEKYSCRKRPYEANEAWQTEIFVDVVSTYLRMEYLYCLWCGCSYEDKQDLEVHCPGTTRQDHDD